MSIPAFFPAFRGFPALVVALCAFLAGGVSASAQTAPVINNLFSPLRAEDGLRLAIVNLYATTSNNSPVTWRVIVGERSLTVDTRSTPGWSTFLSPNYHWTAGYIGPFTMADNGKPVTLVATNAYGNASLDIGLVTVTGAMPREIAIAPWAQSVAAGSDMVFAASAGGSPPLRYQWKKNGVEIPGATSPSYLIRGVQVSDAGTYDVFVTNAYGTGSRGATLEVTIAAPVVTRAPASVSVQAGATTTFEVVMGGSPPFTFKWRKDRNDLPDTNSNKLTLSNVQPSDAGGYDVIVSNSVGTVVSQAATLTVTGSLITITQQPRDTTAGAGSSTALFVFASASFPLTYQWHKDGVAIPGATASRLEFSSVQASSAGVYTVVLTSGSASLTSAPATLTVTAPPTITSVTSSGRTLLGRPASLQVVAEGAGPLSYQWLRNGTAIEGATQATLALSSVAMTDRGSYAVTVTNAGGSVTSLPVDLSVVLPGRLVNLSILTALQAGESDFTLGVVLGSSVAGGTKPLLLRAAGPSLAQFGLAGFLADPRLEFFSGATKSGENDDWAGAASVTAAAAQIGAFPLVAPTSKDAALLPSGAGVGAHSVKVSAPAGSTGSVLAELYDATPEAGVTLATPRVVNLSVLKPIGSALTAGFVVGGTTDVTVLVRVIGPTLAGFGVPNFAADPRVELRTGERVVASNNDWAGATALATAFTQVGAFALASDSKDAALLATLAPGSYTVEVSAAAGASGAVLVEVYEVPAPATPVIPVTPAP